MAELRAIAADLGLNNPRTYIASGNLLFDSDRPETEIKAMLEARLAEHTGKPVAVMIRTANELAAVAGANPYADQPGNKVVAIFLDEPPSPAALADCKHRASEEIALGKREIYAHYPDGQGQSRLVIPAASTGTARNMNTVAKLADMACDQVRDARRPA